LVSPSFSRTSAPGEDSSAEQEQERLSFAEVAALSFRALRRLGVSEASLPDAVQEVLLVVHRRRADFGGQSSFRTWVFGIVMRVASVQRRTRRRAQRLFSEDGVVTDRIACTGAGPFEALARSEASLLVHRLLSEMPAELRDVFVLVDLEELTLGDAAEALGIPHSTCRSQLRSARRLFNTKVARERAKRNWSEP
jgi:RNA polymerase sigma-70 factor (ECF subfamily)